ncbi:MAG: ATP-binding cassette domain-containing protein [Acidobacteriota bacterium]
MKTFEIRGLKKEFNSRPALNGLDLKLERGDIYGLLGPNGAGKTTTIKIIAGLLGYDTGKLFIDKNEFERNNLSLKKLISYVPDDPFIYPKLTGEEHLHFFADLYKIPEEKRAEKFDFFFKYFEFELYRHELTETYSAGTRQKLLISQAILVEPEILLLDEPLVSIDPVVGRKFKILLKELAGKGTIIIFATHILPLAQEVSTKIGIIINGKIEVEGSMEELQKSSKGKNLEDFYFEKVMEHENSFKS